VPDEQWRIRVDQDTCQATGMCTSVAPEHFVLRDGCSIPLREVVEPNDDVVDAAEGCPVEAITVLSTTDGRIVAPEPY
jgi:ferredoxin